MARGARVECKEVAGDPGPFLLLSVDYDGKRGRAVLKLYSASTRRLYRAYDATGHKPYFLTDVPPEDLVEKYPEIVSHRGFDHIEVVDKYDALRDRIVKMTKIVARDPLSVGGSRNSMREILRGRAWEAHIKYRNCYIYDTQLVPGMLYRLENGKLVPVEVEVPKELLDKMARIYADKEFLLREIEEWLKLLQAPIPVIRRLAVDIEVYSPTPDRIPNPGEAKYEVIAVSLASNDGLKKVLLLEREGLEKGTSGKIGDVELEYFSSEKEMLKRAFEYISQYPVVLTFNGDNFDLPYLRNRALGLGIREDDVPISLGRDGADLREGVHLDLYKFFNNHAMQVYAFGNKYREAKTLDVISQALLGESKIHHLKPISEMGYEELAEYCFKDAELTLKLTTFENDLVMKLILLMMRISKTSMEDVARTGISAWIKNMLYFEHRKRGYLIPRPEELVKAKGGTATRAIIKGKKYLGAIVIDPLPGIYFNVVVLDFASLYPSVIKRWNLSYETIRCPHPECRDNKIPGLPHWVCKKRLGISSVLVGFLRDFRVYIYKELAKKEADRELRHQYDVIQRALKVFINASYGVFGADTFPLYCPPVAESTTALGRYAIVSSLRKAIELGLTILYGDTDSLFIWNPEESRVEELVRWSERELGIDLEVDKEYKWVALSGRKKNYLGVYKDGRVDVKGLLGKKRNTPEFVKKMFADMVAVLSKASNIGEVEGARETIRKIAQENYTRLRERSFTLDDLAFRVALSKPLDSYTKTTPQHVKAARQLLRYGKVVEVGDVVSFVKTRDGEGVKAILLARIDEVDGEKYVEHMRSATEQVLEALGLSFDEIVGMRRISQFL